MSAENDPIITNTSTNTPIDNQPDTSDNNFDPYNYYDSTHEKPSFFRSTLSTIVDDAKTYVKSAANTLSSAMGAFAGLKFMFNKLQKDQILPQLKNFADLNPQHAEAIAKALPSLGKGMFIGALLGYGGWMLIKALWNYFSYKSTYQNNRENFKNMMKNTETTFRSYYNIPNEKERLIQ